MIPTWKFIRNIILKIIINSDHNILISKHTSTRRMREDKERSFNIAREKNCKKLFFTQTAFSFNCT